MGWCYCYFNSQANPMTPTPEQIEAAIEAIMQTEYRPDRIVASEFAKAALTAAAEVWTKITQEDIEAAKAIIDKTDQTVNRLNFLSTIERCAQELEDAHAECNTLNLLHGAARIRALKDKP